MNIADAKTMLLALCRQPERNIVPYLQGPPGVGKTSIAAQVAEELDIPLIVTNLTTCESVDLRGLPHIENGRTVWANPYPRSGRGILVLDEISSAARDVQVAAHHLVHAEIGSDVGIGPGWHIVLTGNRASDKTHYTAMGAPLRNRLDIIEIEADVAVSVAWMMEHDVHPFICGFLRWRPELLIAREIPGEGAFPSPRAYTECSAILSLDVNVPIEQEMLKGKIGEGAAIEFCAYLRTARELPSIEAIAADQSNAPIPTSPSLLYALITNLSYWSRKTGKSLAKFAARCPAEFALLYIRDIAGHIRLKTDPDIRAWVSEHKALFLEAEL
jgi:hypothetical protein